MIYLVVEIVTINHHKQDDVENEMRRLKLELKQTMEMYSTACKEALTAKQKVPWFLPDTSVSVHRCFSFVP